jgi:ribosomal-protein-serine acetyltransferase
MPNAWPENVIRSEDWQGSNLQCSMNKLPEDDVRDRMEDGQIAVRAFRSDDAAPLHRAVGESITEVAPYETWCHSGYTADEAADYVGWWIDARERNRAFYYAVEEAASGQLLGACGLSDYSAEHRHAMLGYWIRTSRTGRGIATRAARLICTAGFADLGLIRIEIEVPTSNPASQRVAESLGAAREGVLRNKLILPAGPSDVVVYGLLAGEMCDP